MSNKDDFSAAEMAFFEAGEKLAEEAEPAEDFSDLDPEGEERAANWVERALSVLQLVGQKN